MHAVSLYNNLKLSVLITVLLEDLLVLLTFQHSLKPKPQNDLKADFKLYFHFLPWIVHWQIIHRILRTSTLTRPLLWSQAGATQPEYLAFFLLGKRDQKPVGFDVEQTAIFLNPGSSYPQHAELWASRTSQEFTEATTTKTKTTKKQNKHQWREYKQTKAENPFQLTKVSPIKK